MAEYRFGLGDRYPVEPGLNQGVENDGEEAEAEPQREGEEKVRRVKRKRVPDSYELRLLLGQELGKCLEFAANLFYDQDVGGDREREIGFSTAASFALRGEALKVGLEANYRNVSERGERRRAQNLFELGPSFTFKPSARTRVDVAPLAGVTHDSPRLELFAIFSIDFGAPEVEVTAPVSGGRY
jgi:hypothetical protein